jgi:hypothetical protein
VLSADLTHFEQTDPQIHPAAWKLAVHLRGIIRAASAIRTGYTLESALPCRRRPARRTCPGWMRISRHDIPPNVYWGCSNCQDSGVIQGWQNSPYDLRPPRRFDEPGLITVEVTDDDHAELRRLQLLDLESERVVWGAVRDNGRVHMTGTDEDLDDLAASVAFEANQLTDRRRQRRLDELSDKLAAALTPFG